ncbi:hypothetical protein RUND412_008838 [Rhizina undulata]
MGSSILFAYLEIRTIAGIQGAVVYFATSALPLLAFPLLVPILRKKSPDGFILTMWVQKRYGIIASLYQGASSLSQDYVIVHGCIIVCIATNYRCSDGVGWSGGATVGFRISFLTDIIQGAVISLLKVSCSIAIGTSVAIEPSKIGTSDLMKSSLLGYQLIYTFSMVFSSETYVSQTIGCESSPPGPIKIAELACLLLPSSYLLS